MTNDAQMPGTPPSLPEVHAHDSSWELPELAPVLLIVSVGLLVVGSGVATALLFKGQSDFHMGLGWELLAVALRWFDPSTSIMLLLAAALIWWQYGSWSSGRSVDLPDDVVETHVARLRTIAKWNLAAFAVTIAAVLLLILASILLNTYSTDGLQVWAGSVLTISGSLVTLLLSLLGVVGLRRILVASREFLGDDD